ncbi:N6-adenosine-specific RNA methylase IME4/ParB-like chromosome segregation protein Spo0J [Ochrobactrum anthropi]|uniref:MT-A70 family methyltransferase n=1 Tax=Brucella anthropi TaxID=529 RepID=UPI0015F966AE|nr:MT-A70 family methyltransferase [Brucella anthropi]MBA8861767.1 N6-adenosine-specific RNA methylase IME4/ParB-like chromosome segregation protein Spo0J [Brucella anthropi]
MTYPSHPLADIFPMIAEADLKVLAADIAANGQVEPILLLEGKVLDGRNRQAACGMAGVKPIYAEFAGSDPLSFVLSKNLHRRHLSESQRAIAAAMIVDWERGVNQATAGSANLPTRRAAEKLSVSERAVTAARRVREHGAPELIDAIRAGKVSVHAAEALSELQHAEQARVVREEKKAIVAEAKKIRAEQQKVRHAVRLTTMALVAEKGRETAPGKVQRLYPIIYADPPWRFGVYSEETGREKSAENHYPTMDTASISGVLAEIGSPFTPDALLFLWATNPMLLDAVGVMQAWGFTYVHHWIWDKEVAGTGYWGRDRHELLLIGKRGTPPAPLAGTQPETVHRERKSKHSAKPVWFAEQIERLYPDVPKLELFCRSPRPGWDAWGYEAAGRVEE